MNIMKKISQKAAYNGAEAVTIAFLGDSVTQGCFELRRKQAGGIETIFDLENAYHQYLKRMFALLYPSVPVNIINAGISGGNAYGGARRLERDVIRHQPDLTVVSFGLNDSAAGMEGIGQYVGNLEEIFRGLKEAGSEVIFMTPNMMNTYVCVDLTEEEMQNIAADKMITQNEGILDAYVKAAISAAEKFDVRVCDCYAKWKRLKENGVNTTRLLANRINHPIREMHWLFAVSLLETMFD